MSFPQFASIAVRLVEKTPVALWAGWIVTIVAGVAYLAANAPTIN